MRLVKLLRALGAVPFQVAILAAAWGCGGASAPGIDTARAAPTPWEVVRLWNDALEDGDARLAQRYTSATSTEYIRRSFGSLEGLVRIYAINAEERGLGEIVLVSQKVFGDTATVEYLSYYGDGAVSRWTDRLFREDNVWKLAPQFVHSVSDPAETARRAGVDLAAMLPVLEELPEGTRLVREGFSTEGIVAYERQFTGERGAFVLGASQVFGIYAAVKLHSDTGRAASAVRELTADQMIGSLPPGMSFAADPLQLSLIGEVTKGWAVHVSGLDSAVDMYLITFALWRCVVELSVIGPAGGLVLDDLVPFAHVIEERIRRQVPL